MIVETNFKINALEAKLDQLEGFRDAFRDLVSNNKEKTGDELLKELKTTLEDSAYGSNHLSSVFNESEGYLTKGLK